MNAKSISNTLTGKLSRFVMVIALLVIIFSVVPAHKVAAFTTLTSSGKPGYAYLPVIKVYEFWYGTYTVPGTWQTAFQTSTKPQVYRSPSYAGSQYIQAIAVLEKLDAAGNWAVVNYKLQEVLVSSTQTHAIFNNFTFERADPRGYWRVSWIITWFTERGVKVASNTLITNQASEYTVSTTNRLWVIGPGYVRLGGYMTKAW